MEIPFPRDSPLNFNLNQTSKENPLTQEQLLKYFQQNPEMLEKELEKIAQKYKPINCQEYEKLGNLEKYLDEDGGLMIEPTPKFVFKTFDKLKEKIFINIAEHPIIDEPEEKYLVEMENSPGLRIPMSVGRVKEESDKKGEICKVIDVILNPKVVETLLIDINLQLFFIELLKSYIMEKHKIELLGKFSMPKMKYKGKSIEFQRVKGKKNPKIQQMSSEEVKFNEQSSKVFNENKETFFGENSKQIMKPEFQVFLKYEEEEEKMEEFDGDFELSKLSSIIWIFKMPLIITSRYVNLEINEEEMHIKNGNIYEIFLRSPIKVNEKQVKAEFDIEKKELKVEIEVKNTLKEALSKVVNENDENKEKIKIKENKNIEMKTNLLFDLV